MNQNFAAIILGGTGQVGGKAVSELLEIPECREEVMVTRKAHCTTITGTKAIESHELSPNIILESTSEGAAHRAKPSGCQRNSKVLDHPCIIVARGWYL